MKRFSPPPFPLLTVCSLFLTVALLAGSGLGRAAEGTRPSLASLDQLPTLAERIGRIEQFMH